MIFNSGWQLEHAETRSCFCCSADIWIINSLISSPGRFVLPKTSKKYIFSYFHSVQISIPWFENTPPWTCPLGPDFLFLTVILTERCLSSTKHETELILNVNGGLNASFWLCCLSWPGEHRRTRWSQEDFSLRRTLVVGPKGSHFLVSGLNARPYLLSLDWMFRLHSSCGKPRLGLNY